ncbi:hypothetical protein M0R01_01760 [bacterium]|nr:hypothetical protein [bacterium]
MELFITIIIAIIAGLLFGLAATSKAEKFNFVWFFAVTLLSVLLACFMPLLITLWCAMAYYIYKNYGPLSSAGLHATLMFILVGLIFLFGYYCIPSTIENVEVEHIVLTALHSTTESSGTFYLGCGSIDASLYYVYGHMKGSEYIQGLICKSKNVHVYPNRTDGQGHMILYKSYYVRNISAPPTNFFFYGAPEKTEKDYWVDILIPPNSIIQELKI